MDLANTSNVERQSKSEKTIYKRRSSIFRTRVTACDQGEDKDRVTSDIDNKFTSSNDTSGCIAPKEIFNLDEYVERLRQERKNWQKEYKNRRLQRKNLSKQKSSIEKHGQILDMNILTESERTFLLARPNYEYIYKNYQKLLDLTLKISTLNQLVRKINERFMESMDKNISLATKDIIKMTKL